MWCCFLSLHCVFVCTILGSSALEYIRYWQGIVLSYQPQVSYVSPTELDWSTPWVSGYTNLHRVKISCTCRFIIGTSKSVIKNSVCKFLCTKNKNIPMFIWTERVTSYPFIKIIFIILWAAVISKFVQIFYKKSCTKSTQPMSTVISLNHSLACSYFCFYLGTLYQNSLKLVSN